MKAIGLGVVLILVAAGLVFTTSACGSGGGGAPNPTTLWSGTYCMVSFSGENAAPDEASTLWGTIISNGAGLITGGSTTSNDNGTVGAPSPIGSGIVYTVDAGNRLTWIVTGVPAWQGGVTADGRAALIASIAAPGLDPWVFLMLKKGGAFTNASLSGTYNVCAFFHNQGGPADGSNWGITMDFNGAGTVTEGGTPMRNIDGAVGAFGAAAPAPYAVAADGTVTFSYSTFAVSGGVLFGGDLIIASGVTAPGAFPILLVLVRQGAGLSNATFSGSYHTVSLTSPNSGTPQWTTVTRTATADGAGGLTVNAGTQNSDGAITATSAFSEGYTVSSTGTLMIGALSHLGGISPGGHFAVFAGGVAGGDDPEMHILFK